MRRTSVVFAAGGVAVVLVAAVTVVSYVAGSSHRTGASAVTPFIDALPGSGSIAILAAEHQQLVAMDAATQVLVTVSRPATADPAELIAAQSDPASSSSAASPPDPAAAKQIAYNMLPGFGFDQTSQYSCLVSLWDRESGWVYDIENTSSGAYGIPQALPGDKMASAGADWRTSPATQIKWGLGYISQVYGTPCAAWDHEEAVGSY